jgi:hypothetical protein
MAIIF